MFDVLAAVLTKSQLSLVVTLCGLVKSYWCSGGGWCLHYLGQAAKDEWTSWPWKWKHFAPLKHRNYLPATHNKKPKDLNLRKRKYLGQKRNLNIINVKLYTQNKHNCESSLKLSVEAEEYVTLIALSHHIFYLKSKYSDHFGHCFIH